ncbi:MAG: stationary phase or STEss regulating sigma factor [Magnetococcales bacterium]|nr:stationary phase or STEss regulating sigma factor [Magnetococcales bacterium]
MEYFSDQERGKAESTKEDIPDQVWRGIFGHIHSLIDDGSFGESFPETCPDGPAVVGTDYRGFWDACGAENPLLLEYAIQSQRKSSWSFDETENIQLAQGLDQGKPDLLEILDLIQFCFHHVSAPVQGSYHSFFRHHHLTFNQLNGRQAFLEKINRIFERNGIVFRLQADGTIVRILPPEFGQLLDSAQSGSEPGFDGLLNDAKTKILDPDPKVRKEGLERLWDAWERLKTLEEGNDKKAKATNLLDKAAFSPAFRELLEKEARELTSIGNTYQIRHHEQGKNEINDPRQVDYLFFRMLPMITLLLKARSEST